MKTILATQHVTVYHLTPASSHVPYDILPRKTEGAGIDPEVCTGRIY